MTWVCENWLHFLLIITKNILLTYQNHCCCIFPQRCYLKLCKHLRHRVLHKDKKKQSILYTQNSITSCDNHGSQYWVEFLLHMVFG